MQDTKKIGLKQIEDVIKDSGGGGTAKKETLISNLNEQISDQQPDGEKIDSGSALQVFLNHIPISSIPGIKNSFVLDLKTGDTIKDAIQTMYEKNVFGAPISDPLDTDTTIGRLSDRYIGFIDFATMVLWSLEECEKAHIQTQSDGGEAIGNSGIFSMLEQNPDIAQTKIGELAKSFLWDPFFPVNLDDTLFHVLLLLSKHQVQVVPVIEPSNPEVIGFVTQNAVIQLLLQSSGLEWFDSIADKVLSEFRFENEEHVVHVHGDQSIAEALHILYQSRIGVIAVINRGTKKLIGCIRCSDIYLLLENDNLLSNRQNLTVEEFIHMDGGKTDTDPTIERNLGALLSAGTLRLRNGFLPRMDSPVTSRKTDTLKQAMNNLAEKKGSFSFLVDDMQRPTGVLTLRDIIVQFAPPGIDSSIQGGGFFQLALEQSGCRAKNGTIVRNH